MAYTPNEWESGDVVTASKLNSLEQAVGELNMSYTPNNWTDGDVLSAAKMNALEQAVASGGGGGSSDFTTAEVTIATNEGGAQAAVFPFVYDDEYAIVGATFNQLGNKTYTIPLYKGEGDITILEAVTVSVTGDAEYVQADGYIAVTGNCIITIS